MPSTVHSFILQIFSFLFVVTVVLITLGHTVCQAILSSVLILGAGSASILAGGRPGSAGLGQALQKCQREKAKSACSLKGQSCVQRGYLHFIMEDTHIFSPPQSWWCFSGGSDGKESACNVGDLGSIPGLGRSPGEENGYPLQYSCMEISMDRGAWQAIAFHGVAKSQTWLRNFHTILMIDIRKGKYWMNCKWKVCNSGPYVKTKLIFS